MEWNNMLVIRHCFFNVMYKNVNFTILWNWVNLGESFCNRNCCMFDSEWLSPWEHKSRARFLSLTRSKLRLCLANHRTGYFRNLACDWLSIVWAYSEQETENGPSTDHNGGQPGCKWTSQIWNVAHCFETLDHGHCVYTYAISQICRNMMCFHSWIDKLFIPPAILM